MVVYVIDFGIAIISQGRARETLGGGDNMKRREIGIYVR